MFLKGTIVGVIPRGVDSVARMTPGSELFHLDKISRVQPLRKASNDSPAVLTFSADSNYPDARVVLQESYASVMKSLESVILE